TDIPITTTTADPVSENIPDIPVGTVCTVTEDTPPSDFTLTNTDPATGTVTIDADGETVTFTNTRKTGSLVIDKTVVGGTGSESFSVDVDCNDGTAHDKSNEPITDTTDITITGIPTGTVCTVTEDADPLFTTTIVDSDATDDGVVTIDENGETVSITNTRKTGDLIVDKNTEFGAHQDHVFTFHVDCDGTAFDSTFTLTPGDPPHEITGIPTGTVCTVTEDSDPDFELVSVTPPGGTVTIVVGDTTVTFVNSFRHNNQGCTPGYWKNHLDAWPPTGYSPNQTLESVFNVPNEFGLDSKTLLQALSFLGGSTRKAAARILLRAGVAALLNSAHPDVDYPLTTAEVISKVNTALTKSRSAMLTLAKQLDQKNNLGCPLS
ncbi:MAG: DUF5979 domain-containing protein, partial [Nocardioidaceae bacterium]